MRSREEDEWVAKNIIAPTLDGEGVRVYEWDYSGKLKPRHPTLVARDRMALRRQRRMAAAKAKGTHSKDEWMVLAGLFDRCVICGVPYEDLHGGHPSKDHIQPIHADGCDCIGNIQPVCKNCNSAKTGDVTDYRNRARPDWQAAFLAAFSSEQP